MIEVERREHIRFDVKEGPILLEANKIGKILNISKSGMLCLCFFERQHSKGNELTIYCPFGDFSIHGIPYEVMREAELPDAFGKLSFHQCAIKIGDLSATQNKLMEEFFDKFTYNKES